MLKTKRILLTILIVLLLLLIPNVVKAEEESTNFETTEETDKVDELEKIEEVTKTDESVEVEETVEWTDFSKAKYELEKGVNVVSLLISNVEELEEKNFYYIITEDKTKPNIKDYDELDTYVKNEGDYLRIYGLEEFFELNQDVYVWIVEKIWDSVDYKYVYNFVVQGKKIQRPEYSNLFDVFTDYSHISNDNTQICLNIPWDENTVRKMNVKIGKITDKSILKKIKNDEDSGWSELLTYSKSAKTIYDKNLISTDRRSI